MDGINDDHVDDVLLLLERELHNDDDNDRMDDVDVQEEEETVDDEIRFDWRCLPDNSLPDNDPFNVRSISGTI